MCDTIIIDAKDILFCCGPCNSIDIEPEPILFNNNTEKYYLYKPHTGGRYPGYSWVLSNNKTLLVKNIRVCYNCFHHETLISASGLTHIKASRLCFCLI